MSLDRAQLSIKFYLDRLRAQTAQLDARDYPSDHPGPRKWLALVHGLLDTADAYLRSSRPSTRSRARAVRDAADLASQAYRCLVLMRGAGLDELPYPIVGPLQAWFTELAVQTDTVFRAELLANYELRPIPDIPFKGIRRPSRTLSNAISDIDWPIWTITVPAQALGISTHFAIVAHELGHVLFTRITWDLAPISAELARLKQNVAARLRTTTIGSELFAFLSNVFQDWFQEFASDAFAFLLTGPAFFFSLSDFFQLGPGIYGISNTHPAYDLRRRALYDRLSLGGARSHAEIFKIHTGSSLTEGFNSPLIRKGLNTNDILSHLVSLTRSGGRRVYEDDQAHVLAELHDFMPIVIPLIFKHVHTYLQDNAPGMIYTVDKYDADLAAHMKPMLLAIPPIESGVKLTERQAAEFASILNVGWAVLLTKLDELQVRVGDDPLRAERLEKLHGLLLKAVELSEARRVWGNA